MPLQSSILHASPSLPPAVRDGNDTQAPATASATLPLSPGNRGEQTARIALLPSELLANIADFLSPHEANALSNTASAFWDWLATSRCEARASRARTVADFDRLIADMMPAPAAFRRHVIALLDDRIGALPPMESRRAVGTLRGALFSTIDIEAAERNVRNDGDVRRLVRDATDAPDATRVALARALWDRIASLDVCAQPGSCRARVGLITNTESIGRDPLWMERVVELYTLSDTAQIKVTKAQREQEFQRQRDALLVQHLATWLADPRGPLQGLLNDTAHDRQGHP